MQPGDETAHDAGDQAEFGRDAGRDGHAHAQRQGDEEDDERRGEVLPQMRESLVIVARSQRLEGVGVRTVRLDGAGVDLVVPAVQPELTCSSGRRATHGYERSRSSWVRTWLCTASATVGSSTAPSGRGVACASQSRTAGTAVRSSPRTSAPTAPQWEWPQTTMSATPSTSTAYSMVAASRWAARRRTGGTMLPAVRSSKSSPGRAPVIRAGTTRESEQVMNRTCGDWPSASGRTPPGAVLGLLAEGACVIDEGLHVSVPPGAPQGASVYKTERCGYGDMTPRRRARRTWRGEGGSGRSRFVPGGVGQQRKT